MLLQAETSRRRELRLIKNQWLERKEGNAESKQNPYEIQIKRDWKAWLCFL